MNLFVEFDDVNIITPPLNEPTLPGTTRASIIDLAIRRGIPIDERRYAIDNWRRTPKAGGCAKSSPAARPPS